MKREEVTACILKIKEKFSFAKSCGNEILYKTMPDEMWQFFDAPDSSKHFMEIILKTNKYIPSTKEVAELKILVKQAIELEMLQLVALDVPSGVRVVRNGNTIYIDLGDNALRVSSKGFKVVKGSKIAFRRNPKQFKLKEPDGIAEIRELFLKFGCSDEQIDIIVFFIICCFGPTKSFPVLVITGPAGSGKTSLVKAIKTLIDPEESVTIPMPTTCQALRVAAASKHLLAIDNCSEVKTRIEDELCTISTGTSVVERKLYTNFETDQRKYCCPIVISSVSQFSSRTDLQDRMLYLELERPAEMMTNEEIDALVEEYQPKILKWIAELLQCISANEDSKPVVTSSRLVDSIRFASKGAAYMGKKKSFFARLVEENQERIRLDNASTSPLVREIDRMMMKRAFSVTNPEEWRIENEPSEIFSLMVKDSLFVSRRDSAMPKTPAAFGKKLNYIKGTLKSKGILVNSWHTGKMRLISFEYTVEQREKVIEKKAQLQKMQKNLALAEMEAF